MANPTFLGDHVPVTCCRCSQPVNVQGLILHSRFAEWSLCYDCRVEFMAWLETKPYTLDDCLWPDDAAAVREEWGRSPPYSNWRAKTKKERKG